MNDHGEVRARFRIKGRVQGVGFRWWIARHARALSLSGMVENEGDGSVSVEAEGSMADLAQLRELLLEGPPNADVEGVEDLTPSRSPLPNPFSIRA